MRAAVVGVITYDECAHCTAPCLSARSRDLGLCAACIAVADNTPTSATGVVEHEPGCTNPQIVEPETPRRRVLVCRTCRAHLVLTRVNRWRA